MAADTPPTSAACCEVHKFGKCDAMFTCCERCPTFFGDRPVVTSPESASGRDSDRSDAVPGSAANAQLSDAALPSERLFITTGSIARDSVAWLRQARDAARVVEADREFPTSMRCAAANFADKANEFLRGLR